MSAQEIEVEPVSRPETVYTYPSLAAPAGGFPGGHRRKYAVAALKKQKIDDRDPPHDIGFRAGKRDGFAVERTEDGHYEAVKYGPLHSDNGTPYGQKRVVFFRA